MPIPGLTVTELPGPGVYTDELPYKGSIRRAFEATPAKPFSPEGKLYSARLTNEAMGPQRPGGLRAPTSVPTPPPAGPAEPPSRRAAVFEGLGRTAGRGVRAVAPIARAVAPIARAVAPIARAAGPIGAVAGTVSGFNDYKLDDPDVDSSAMGTWNALRDGDFGDVGKNLMQGDVGGAWDAFTQSGVGKSLGKGLLETGMDVGSGIANTLDYVVPGKAPVSTAYNRGLRSTFGDQLIDNSGTGQLATQRPAGVRAQAPTALPGQPTPSALPAVQPVPSPSGQALAASAPVAPAVAGPRATSQEVIAAAQALDAANGNTPGVTGFRGSNDDSASKFRQQVSRSNLETGIRDALRNPNARAQAAGLQAAQGLVDDDMRQDGVRMANETQRDVATMNNETQRTGLRAQQTAAQRSTQADLYKTMLEQGNKDRDYKLRVKQEDRATKDSDLAAATTSSKAFQENVGNLFRVQTRDKDGNVTTASDTAKVAAFTKFAQTGMASRLAAARKSDDPAMRAAAEDLAARGVQDLDPQTMHKWQAAFAFRDRIKEAKGLGPGSAKFIDSDNPDDFEVVDVQPSGLGKVRLITRNGSEINLADTEYTELANTILPDWFKSRSNQFDVLIPEGLRQGGRQ